MRSPRDGVRDQPIKPNASKHQCESGKAARKQPEQTLLDQGFGNLFRLRFKFCHWQLRIDLVDGRSDGRYEGERITWSS